MDSTAFKPWWTPVNGLTVFARVASRAPADAPDVVLVHGLGLSGTYLMPTARELARDYRVWVPDLPGFGRSGKPRRVWDVSELADGLAAWMEAVGLGKAALLGNSFGCQIIIECAARHPQRVERAVLQGPTTAPEERSWLWQFVRWRQNPNPGMDPIAYRDYWAAGIYRVLRTFHYSIQHRPEDRLPEIAIPVLVVRGSADPICRQDWAEEVAQRLPRGGAGGGAGRSSHHGLSKCPRAGRGMRCLSRRSRRAAQRLAWSTGAGVTLGAARRIRFRFGHGPSHRRRFARVRLSDGRAWAALGCAVHPRSRRRPERSARAAQRASL